MGSVSKVETLEKVFTERDPFCSGVCSVPEHQLLLYYAQGEDFHVNRIDFAHSTIEGLEALSEACQPVSVGFNKDSDESHGKMGLDTFSTSLDPRSVGIHDIIERHLLSTNQTVELELYKLDVYGKDGLSKDHQDIPCKDDMFGTLVVVLPAPHVGGQFSFCVDKRQWTMDFMDQFAAATDPSICFVAFLGNVQCQVLPVISGYCVTLTYNLYFRPDAQRDMPRLCRLPSSFHDRLKEALIALVNDPETLPNGGYLTLGLCCPYAYDGTKPVDSLQDRLQGPDAALASVCAALGLPCVLRLVYAKDCPEFYMLSRVKLNTKRSYKGYCEEESNEFLREAVCELTQDDLEGVDIIGYKPTFAEMDEELGGYEFMEQFYRDPVSQMLEIKESSSVVCETSFAYYGGCEATLIRFYGTAAMVISVKPMESRKRLAK